MNRNLKYIFLALLSFSFMGMKAQHNPTPAPKQSKSVLIMNATAHLGNGQVIENSVVGFVNGKITMVADARTVRIDMTKYDEVIQAAGQHLYPGFIAPNSTLGLQEFEQVRQSRDYREVGMYKSSVRTLTTYNTDSEIIPTVRLNGVLMSQPTPRGGVVSGTSSIVQHDAWNWDEAVIKADDGLHVYWPEVYQRQQERGKSDIEKSKSYDTMKRELETFFQDAKAYSTQKNPSIIEVRFEGVRGVFDGSKILYIHADDAKAITEAVNFKKEMGVAKMVIVGGYDAYQVAPLLKENGVTVMLNRVHSLPLYDDDDIDLPYKLPRLMQESGVQWCFENSGEQEHHLERNLPFYAGTAVAYGLGYEQAVAALTLNTATIMGVADRLGSIESGKDATLFLSSGDALDMRTNHLTYAFIEGRQIELKSKQTEMYDKYKKKYDGK